MPSEKLYYSLENANVHTGLLKKMKPSKIVLVAFMVWMVLFFTAPLKVNIELNIAAYILMGLGISAFLLGSYLPSKSFSTISLTENRLKSVMKVIIVVAAVGVVLKLTDRFLIRGISIGGGNMMNRELMSSGSGNIIGVVGATLAPFAYIPLFLLWKYKIKLWFFLKLIVYALFLMQIFDALLLGSRSAIFVNFTMLLLYLLYFRKVVLRWYTYILMGIALFMFAVVMNYMFVQRTKEFFGDKVYELVLNESGFNYTCTATDEFKKEFRNYSSVGKSVAFTYIVTTQYFTHGVLEFSHLYSEYSHPYKYGVVTFDLYARMLDKVSPVQLSAGDPEDFMPRNGVYTTMIGPFFIDFGWLLIPFMFLFGRVVKMVYRTAIKQVDWAVILYFYLSLVLVFWPVFNFINGAGGLYTITGIIVFGLMSRYIYAQSNFVP